MKKVTMILCLAVVFGCGDDDTTPDMGAGDTPPAGCADLGSTTSGLQIAEVKVGDYIVFFNATDSAIDFSGTTLTICNQPAYANLSDIAGGVTVPARGYARIGWPETDAGNDWPAETSGGEFAIYEGRNFSDGAAIVDYVCWGNGGDGQRKDEAEGAGTWSGDCTAAPSDAIVRLPNTAGTTSADYEVTGATPGACTNP